jgi:hypothetical protein
MVEVFPVFSVKKIGWIKLILYSPPQGGILCPFAYSDDYGAGYLSKDIPASKTTEWDWNFETFSKFEHTITPNLPIIFQFRHMIGAVSGNPWNYLWITFQLGDWDGNSFNKFYEVTIQPNICRDGAWHTRYFQLPSVSSPYKVTNRLRLNLHFKLQETTGYGTSYAFSVAGGTDNSHILLGLSL